MLQATDFCYPGLLATTVLEIRPNDLPITSTWLNKKVARFLEVDDVFNPHFLASVTFVYRTALEKLFSEDELDIADFLKQWNVTDYFMSTQIWSDDELNEGAYLLTCEGLKQAWRVYEDTLDAFQVGVIPSVHDPNK